MVAPPTTIIGILISGGRGASMAKVEATIFSEIINFITSLLSIFAYILYS